MQLHIFLDQNPNLKVVACKQHNQYIAEFTLIRALVDELMHYILVLPTKIFNPLVYLIRNSLTKELPYIGYFSSILPKVFEDVKIKQSIDYPRQKYKIRKAINNFVKLVCSQLDHVYIHFDDLQWADENALDIVKGLLKDKTIGANFILSYRDDFNGLFKEEKSYDVFLLSPFTLDEVKEIIDKKISLSKVNSEYLANYIHGLTLGNPFYIDKVIESLCQNKTIEKESGYSVHINQLTKLNVSENINQVMLSRVFSLNEDEMLFLECLSCFDGSISKDHYTNTFGQPSEPLLQYLVDNAFIFVTDDRYSFTHDIIHEYIDSQIEFSKKEKLYYTIAVKLTPIYKSQKNVWPILVTAIINSKNIEWASESIGEWLTLLNEAPNHNLNYKKTRDILLLSKDIMDKYPKFYDFSSLLKLAKCHYLLGENQQAKCLYSQTKNYAKDQWQMLKVLDEEMTMLAYIGHHEEAVNTGIEMLKIHGFVYDVNNIHDLIIKLKSLNVVKDLDTWTFKNEKENIIDEQYILYRMIPSTKITSQDDFQYCMLLIASLALKKSQSKYKFFAVTTCAFVMFTVLNNEKIGRQLSNLIMKNMAFDSEDDFIQETIAFYLTFVHHWSNDISETSMLLEKNNSICLEKGIITHFDYSLASLMFSYYVSGKNLSEASQSIQRRIELLDSTLITEKQFIDTYVNAELDVFRQTIIDKKPIVLPSEPIKIELVVSIWFKVIANYLNNYIAMAYSGLEILKDYFDGVKGHILYIDMICLSTLIMI